MANTTVSRCLISSSSPCSQFRTVDKYFQRECKILQEARHPNIVQYLGLALAPTPTPTDGATPSTRKRILIISEFIPHGNLRTYIYQTEIPFPWRLRLSFAIDITRALYYLHQRQCIHRDLKGENLLVTENHRIKVSRVVSALFL